MSVPLVPEPIDQNKILVEFLQANLENLLALGKQGVTSARNKVRVRLESTYGTYVTRLLERHSTAKSFFVKREPVPLYSFFVPLDLSTQRRTLFSASARDIAAVATRAIITGSGGCGKSMIMRHLLLSCLRSREKTPIFLELRNIDLAEETLEAALLRSLTFNGLDIDADYFRLALSAGHFMLLLDGFDELDHKGRKKASAALQALVERYPQNWCVLSSRPDEALEGWTAFTLFRVDPLTLDKAVALVARLAFDDEVKARFTKDLRTELFERHKSFLSNPLLLSIMLLTYHDTANIPSKLSIFYNQAYESLFQKHDALKGGYQRQRRTTLDIQDFARAFAAFCVRTYSRRQFTFPVTTALQDMERAREVTRLNFSPSDFLDDARQAVCMLVEEGTDLAFAHRSFQEYFSALFISQSPPVLKGQLIRKFSAAIDTDTVLDLLFEIDQFAVEQHYILPALAKLRVGVGAKKTVGVMAHAKYLQLLFKSFQFESSDTPRYMITLNDVSLFNAVRFASARYSADGGPFTEREALGEQLREAFAGAKSAEMAEAVKNPRLLKALRQSSGFLGLDYLRLVMNVEAEIRSRHQSVDAALEAILG